MLQKNHKKLVLMATVLTMAALLVCCLSMSVFAGTGSTGIPTAPTIKKVSSFEIFDEEENKITDTRKAVDVGGVVVLTAGSFESADAYDDYKTVAWESENSDVATVDENGNVTAVSPGEVTITATAKNGSTTNTDWVEKKVTIIVKGLVVSSMTVDGDSSTVSGTVYGGEGGNPVSAFNDAIKNIVRLSSDSYVYIKGAVAVQENGTLKVYGTLCVNLGSTLYVRPGGELNVTGRLYVRPGGELNVNGVLNVNGTLDVNEDGTLYVNPGGELNVKDGGQFFVSENGKPEQQISGTYSNKKFQGT